MTGALTVDAAPGRGGADAPGGADTPGGAARPALPPRVILAGALGNMLEWYDFAACGYLAAVFAKNFFPAGDSFVGLISAFGIFAASFLMRPLGGIVFGHVGDRYGRRAALLLSVALMCVSTVAIGLLPTYAAIGILAPALLLVLRLLQGLSIGGEYTTSAIFLAEQSPPRWRGFITGFSSMGATAGILLGSAVAALVASLMPEADMVAWGWRVPFLLGIVLGLATLLLRRTAAFDAAPAAPLAEAPLVVAFATDGRNILRAAVLNAMLGAGFYMLFVYLATYMQQVDRLPERMALQINTASMVLLLVLSPLCAALSDMLGRKVLLVGSLAGFALFSWPLFAMLSSGQAGQVMLAQAGFAVLTAAYCAPMPAILVEMFRRATRCSAMSVGYNIALGLIGGTAPMVAVYLVNRLDDDMGPAIYLIVVALISLAAALTVTDKARQVLD
ncbi:MFS transporter [Azorhizobium doebereinerae]|uniref:MFS transporter n=1 Tax=Azorhizobium doebereinerae TaxID=281091 RepID=UPI00042A6590|nr:MFS transporter [Azorhizobium doebereinerae]